MGLLYHGVGFAYYIRFGSPEPHSNNKLKFPRLVFYNGFLLETKKQLTIQKTMKTFRMVGMALFAVLMCVNFAACGGSDDDPTEEPTTDLSKIIIGTWVQDGDDDIMVIKSDKTLTWYENETDYKNNEVSEIYQWEVKGEWLNLYYEGRQKEMRPKEIKENIIIWKEYGEYNDDYSDSYGSYDLWTWERYSK